MDIMTGISCLLATAGRSPAFPLAALSRGGGRGQSGRDPSGAAGSREAVALRPAPERGALGPAQRCGQPGDAPPRLPPPAGIAEPAWEVPGADRGR